MTKRPVSVTILAWIYIAVGALTFVFPFLPTAPPLQSDVIWAELLRFAAVVSGAYMLRASNWARWLAIIWIGVHVIISAFHPVFELAVHSVICALAAYFLFRPAATRYFRRAAVQGGAS